ncbi:SDR family oxidoreductase [Candidatus Finniella inopinata]|uniref:SDR family oxidoreductase n=1 Tax=Candidatus Finniella inopinata TaxID=1696036 RepID=A0A4Q7DLZ8_9PROT|nr:SDR family oxidoreductase [Candidatus Finniella inopinata]RZI45796.1 SDR family oxidoreductase [Candidatus Finniella inopinata]
MKIKVIVFLLFLPIYASVAGTKNTIMVTAATGELGQAICEQLAFKGNNLVIAGRNPEKIEALKKSLNSKYKEIQVQSIHIDFSDTKTIEDAAKIVSQNSLKGIVLIGPRPLLSREGIPDKGKWAKVFEETFIAPLEVVRSFQPHLQNNGSIVIISGNSSKNYLPSYPNTNVIRLAWTGEIKNLMHFFGERKIRVNAISPGVILTNHHIERITAKAASNKVTFEEQLAKDTAAIPLKSYGKPDDVGNLVSFLLSTKSDHLNGTNIVLDGGESNAY